MKSLLLKQNNTMKKHTTATEYWKGVWLLQSTDLELIWN